MYILNIARATKKMSVNEIKDFIFEKYYKKKWIFKGKQLLFKEMLEKKQLLLFANKLIEKIPDPQMLKNTINHL